jgi:hypothetical protein
LRDGRIVVSARPSDVTLARSAIDIQSTMTKWSKMRHADEEYTRQSDALVTSEDAGATLRWALSQFPLSLEVGVALRVLTNSPSWLLLEVIEEVVRLAAEGDHPDEIRRVIAAAGQSVSYALLSAVNSMLASSKMTLQQYSRLAELLKDVGADQALNRVIDVMLTSEDAGIHAAGKAFRMSGAEEE